MRAPFVLPLVLLLGCAPATHLPLASSGSWSQSHEAEEMRVELAGAMVDSDRPEAALKIIRKARSEGIAGPDLSVVQARALLAQGLDAEAESLLDEVVGRHPRHAAAQAELGALYLRQGRTEDALVALRQAVRVAPGVARRHNNLGFGLLVAGRYAQAAEALAEAVRLDPSSARARNNFGFALAALGRVDEARQEFRAVVGPQDAELNLRLAAELYPPVPPEEEP